MTSPLLKLLPTLNHSRFLLPLLLLTLTSCAPRDPFASFAASFGKTARFACADIGGRTVLLVSHEVFGPDTAAALPAVSASIFALDPDGKIVTLGSIRSQGTLYPVSLSDGRLLVAGHHFVSIYEIRGEEPELALYAHEECDSTTPTPPALQTLFNTFSTATPITFQTSLPKQHTSSTD